MPGYMEKFNLLTAAWYATGAGRLTYVSDADDEALYITSDGPGPAFRVPYAEADGVFTFAPMSQWTEIERKVEWVEKSLSPELLVVSGGAIKSLGDGRVGGYLVVFSGPNDPDLEGDYFTKDTDFGLLSTPRTGVYYDHGLDPVIGKRMLGEGMLKVDDVGVWVESQLALRDRYETAIYDLGIAGKLGWSSGTSPTLIERKRVGKVWNITKWVLGLDASMTPIPAEPRTGVVALKSYATMSLTNLLRGPGEGRGDKSAAPFTPEQINALRAEIRAKFNSRE